MSVITSGKTFANGEQLTADKLNQVITAATFNATEAVDNSTTQIDGSGAIVVRDGGISTAKLVDSNVTKAKIEDVADMKVLGNTSGSASAPQEVSILDEDDMSSDSATSLATQQSIKAYVDDNGITQSTGSAPYFGCRAFGAFNGGASTPITPISSGNIESIVRTSTGNYTITFTTAMPSSDYTVVANENHATDITFGTNATVTIVNASSFRLRTGQITSGAGFNSDYISFSVFV